MPSWTVASSTDPWDKAGTNWPCLQHELWSRRDLTSTIATASTKILARIGAWDVEVEDVQEPRMRQELCGPISHYIAILSLQYPISSSTKWCEPPWVLSFTQAHLCDTPLCNLSRDHCAIPIKTSTEEFCDAIATSIAWYEEYRCWASKDRNVKVFPDILNGEHICVMLPFCGSWSQCHELTTLRQFDVGIETHVIDWSITQHILGCCIHPASIAAHKVWLVIGTSAPALALDASNEALQNLAWTGALMKQCSGKQLQHHRKPSLNQ